MHKLTKAIKQKKLEAACRELNDLINSLHLPKEVSITYTFNHYLEYNAIDMHFYKWEFDEYGMRNNITASVWFSAMTGVSHFSKKINAMRNALIAFKKGKFVWSEQAAIAEQTH
jgi:hypothetical protein